MVRTNSQMNSPKRPFTIGLGILSWRARKTLRASLESYRRGNLFSLFDDTLIFFQEMEKEDMALAEEFGLRATGNDENTGIMGGMKQIAERLTTDYILHLENDLSLITDGETAQQQMDIALQHMDSGATNFYRMDYRKPPINENDTLKRYLRYHPAPLLNQADSFARRLRRLLRPAKARRLLGNAVYADTAPHERFPNYIRPLDGGHWAVDSATLSWGNRAPLYPRRKFLNEIIAYAEAHPSSRTVNGKPDLEKELNCRHWRNRHYQMGICVPGLFAHKRLDRPPEDEKGW